MTEPLSRKERRKQTEQRILDNARALFGASGYERTTIRAVAERAGVDPALVMQYFGSKQGLFSAAVRAAPEPGFAGRPEQLVDFLTETMKLKLSESGEQPMVMLRSMLTHPEATKQARASIDGQAGRIAEAIPADEARLRGALVTSVMLGIRIGRELLELDALADASVDEVAALARPVFDALVSDEAAAVPPTGT